MSGIPAIKMNSIDPDSCAVPRCRGGAWLTYTHHGVSIGVCAHHWDLHCLRVPTVNLKQICDSKVQKNGTKISD
jgi:hypothetical protein